MRVILTDPESRKERNNETHRSHPIALRTMPFTYSASRMKCSDSALSQTGEGGCMCVCALLAVICSCSHSIVSLSPTVRKVVHLHRFRAIQQGHLAAIEGRQIERLAVYLSWKLLQDLALPKNAVLERRKRSTKK